MGIDLGYTEPTAIIVAYIDSMNRLRFHCNLRLEKVSYTIQDRFIDALDSKFGPDIIGIDESGVGKPVVQRLLEAQDFSKKNYKDRLVPISFSQNTVIGYDGNNEEIKSRTKPMAVSILQEYSNNHKIVFSSTNMEIVSELERMTYTKTPSGEIVYKTLTERGGKKGEDHFTSALLCMCLAHYLKNESFNFTKKKGALAPSFWVG
jgi:hypothetical protein